MPDPAQTVATEARTHVSQRWLLKMVIIAAVLIGFGLWGYWDASVVYPSRGAVAAEWLEFQYLDVFARERAPLDARASVSDPGAEYARLTRDEADKGSLPTTDRALKSWLEQLALIGHLDGPAATAIPRTDFRGEQIDTSRQRLETLRTRWTTSDGTARKSPNSLSKWDIPVQWLITVVGLLAGLYLVLLIVLARAKVYRWDSAEQRLTLPGGASIVPGDVEELDKRLWHKFFVSLKIRASHSQLGGRSVKLDLLRYEPLEEWVLAMEKTAFPTPPDEPTGETPTPAAPTT